MQKLGVWEFLLVVQRRFYPVVNSREGFFSRRLYQLNRGQKVLLEAFVPERADFCADCVPLRSAKETFQLIICLHGWSCVSSCPLCPPTGVPKTSETKAFH